MGVNDAPEAHPGRLVAELSLTPGTRFASFQELASIPRLMELIREARRRSEIEEPLDPEVALVRPDGLPFLGPGKKLGTQLDGLAGADQQRTRSRRSCR